LFAAGWLSIAVAIPKPLSLLLASGLIGQAAHLGINIAMLRWALRPTAGGQPELAA
jgi:hypothetical protein